MPNSVTNAHYGNRVLYVSILVSFMFFLLIIHLVRKRKLSERFALAWMLIPLLLLVFSSNRKLLESMAALVGIYYAPAIMIPIIFGLFIIVSLYFTVKVSKAEQQIKTLTQELGILKHSINALTAKKEKSEAPDGMGSKEPTSQRKNSPGSR